MSHLICLTGASGMTGRALLELLVAQGERVRASYHDIHSFLPTLAGVEWVRTDLRSRAACRQLVQGCDEVIHMAAITGGSGASQKAPWDQLTDNLVMGAELLHGAHDEGIKRVTLVGSATCYGPSDRPLREEELDLNIDPYEAHFGIGWVTRSLEKLGLFWHKKTDMEIIHIRASNIFGPFARFDPRISNFIPALILKAVDKVDPFEIWGEPGVVRDVIYSHDFARQLFALSRKKSLTYGIFNVGSGKETTVDQVVRWCLIYSGHTPNKVNYSGSSASATKYRVLDCSKLRNEVGEIETVGIEAGIAATVEWYRENKMVWKR